MSGLLAFALVTAIAAPAEAQVAHICWVERVVAEGSGARIVFSPSAPLRPDETSVHRDVGESIAPANSGHDGCTITVARRDGVLGVVATAHFFALYITAEPEVREEWIAASRAP